MWYDKGGGKKHAEPTSCPSARRCRRAAQQPRHSSPAGDTGHHNGTDGRAGLRTGLHRTVEGRLTRFDTQTTFRNGLGFYAVMVNIGRGDDPEDDRLLYWDASLPKPALHEGDRVLFLVHGNEIIGLQKQ